MAVLEHLDYLPLVSMAYNGRLLGLLLLFLIFIFLLDLFLGCLLSLIDRVEHSVHLLPSNVLYLVFERPALLLEVVDCPSHVYHFFLTLSGKLVELARATGHSH